MQWVDFYLAEYKPQPMTFDSRFAATAFGVIVVLIFILGIWQEFEVSRFDSLLAQKKQQVKQTEQQIKAMQTSLEAIQQNQSTDQTIYRKREELKALNLVVSGLQEKARQQATPYSQVMSDLGEHTADKLWLTQILIEQGVLSLRGSTTKRESIPGYIEQLNQANSLNREFSALTVEKDSDHQRIIHFSLDGGVLSDPGAGNQGASNHGG